MTTNELREAAQRAAHILDVITDRCELGAYQTDAEDACGGLRAALTATTNEAAAQADGPKCHVTGVCRDATQCEIEGACVALTALTTQPVQAQGEVDSHAEVVRQLRGLKVLLGVDSPNVRGWAAAVQQGAQKTVNAAISALSSPATDEPLAWRYWFRTDPPSGNGMTAGPVTTDKREVAYGVGCFDQQPLYAHPAPAVDRGLSEAQECEAAFKKAYDDEPDRRDDRRWFDLGWQARALAASAPSQAEPETLLASLRAEQERLGVVGKRSALPFNADDLKLPLPALPEPFIASTENEYALHRAPETHSFGATCYRLGLKHAAPSQAGSCQASGEFNIPRGWKAESLPPSSYLTNEANDARQWCVARAEAPYEGKDRQRTWFGPTLQAAFDSAFRSMPKFAVAPPAGRTLTDAPEIDYDVLIKAGFDLYRYRQGSGVCVAFARGAEWYRQHHSRGAAVNAFVTVKPSALSPEARAALALAKSEWRRMPSAAVHLAPDLERMGLIQTRVDWQWSTRHSGAGRHVCFWRLATAVERG